MTRIRQNMERHQQKTGSTENEKVRQAGRQPKKPVERTRPSTGQQRGRPYDRERGPPPNRQPPWRTQVPQALLPPAVLPLAPPPPGLPPMDASPQQLAWEMQDLRNMVSQLILRPAPSQAPPAQPLAGCIPTQSSIAACDGNEDHFRAASIAVRGGSTAGFSPGGQAHRQASPP